ncbi:hypothetical protein GW17_00057427 [Ensete ventricosum]|nr:hypothetical protein GW17_00057427 [Ensete ventricosum]
MGIVVETMRPSKSLLPRPRRPYPSSTAHLPLPRRDPRPPWDPRRRRHLCPAARSRMIRPQSGKTHTARYIPVRLLTGDPPTLPPQDHVTGPIDGFEETRSLYLLDGLIQLFLSRCRLGILICLFFDGDLRSLLLGFVVGIQGVGGPRGVARGGDRGGGWRTFLPPPPLQRVPEPGGRHHPRPVRLLPLPGQTPRSNPRQAYDPGLTSLIDLFSLSDLRVQI